MAQQTKFDLLVNMKNGQGIRLDAVAAVPHARGPSDRATSRRDLLLLLGAGAVAPSFALAQTKRPVVIGWLHPASSASSAHYLAAFKDGLAALGWKEDSQARIEARWGDDRIEQLKALAPELAAMKPAVIVAAGLRGVRAAASAAPGTPVVSASSGDLVAAGFAANLARPGGMVTGLTNFRGDLAEKYVELLLEAAPGLKQVGFLADANAEMHPMMIAGARRAAERYPIKAWYAVAKPEDVEPAILRLAKDGADALIVLNSFNTMRQRIMKLAQARRWPTICPEREYAQEGALLSYSIDTSANYHRAAYYVDRILKGAKPGDLPIEQPTKFELVVNLKTAKALGITIPQSILVRADRVIE